MCDLGDYALAAFTFSLAFTACAAGVVALAFTWKELRSRGGE